MLKKLHKLFLVVPLLFIGCNLQPTTQSEIASNDLQVSIALRAADVPLFRSATVIVSADDILTIASELVLTDTILKGTVKQIPTGQSRLFEINVYGDGQILLYRGSATADVLPGKTIAISIKLIRLTGDAEITGYIETQNKIPFVKDNLTLALFHFDENDGELLLDEVGKFDGNLNTATRSDGISGKAIKVSNGTYASFDTIIPDGLAGGTIEFFFRKGAEFTDGGQYALFGNDGSRVSILYKAGKLYFLKNHSDVFKIVSATQTFMDEQWYHIAATWGSKGMRLFVNDSLIAGNSDFSAYRQSPRTVLENYLYIGYKRTGCCMEGIGISTPLGLEGTMDELRISNIERY